MRITIKPESECPGLKNWIMACGACGYIGDPNEAYAPCCGYGFRTLIEGEEKEIRAFRLGWIKSLEVCKYKSHEG